MAKRKTFDVEKFKEQANNALQVSKGVIGPKERVGIYLTLETVLHETGNYKGYGYLTRNDVPAGELPGINTDEEGNVLPYDPQNGDNRRFNNCDDTRRYYY